MQSSGYGHEVQRFAQGWESATLEPVNLAILGGTGVGKSTLVNAVFGEDLAETGIGRPVTSGVNFYRRGDLGLYDFEGLESFASLKSFTDEFKKVYRKRLKQDPESAIHAVWYCIKASDRRLDDQQEKALRRLAVDMKLPVFLVLTQTPWYPDRGVDPATTAFLQHMVERRLPIVGGEAIPVAAIDDPYTGTVKFGLEALVSRTMEAVPEGRRAAFSAAQRVDPDSKSREARRIVHRATASAAAVAATPIPMADAPLLVGVQATMMARVAKVYEVRLSTSNAAKALAGVAATTVGRSLVGSLLKLIPGAGNVINASVAGAITSGLGYAWLELCRRDWLGQLNLESLAEHGELSSVLLRQYRLKVGDGKTIEPGPGPRD